MDLVRVLRVIEYVGDRDVIEEQINGSLGDGTHLYRHGRVEVRVATIGGFPEILSNGEIK
jgi:hypothetical protein